MPPVERRDAWRMFAASAGTWSFDGAGWWAVELAATGEVVGTCGAFYREPHPERETRGDELELGWAIFPSFRRRGFAKEAAEAALAFGRDTVGAPRVIAHIAAQNAASIRVSERIGMQFEREVAFYGARMRLYAVGR